MSKPAARLTDLHTCPLSDGPKPHVGGPITAPGCPTVIVGGMPAARVGDVCTCAGPPDAIAEGSCTVRIGGQPAARVGDKTVHGGVIVTGAPTVLIGDVGSDGRLELAKELITVTGTADQTDADLVAKELAKLPKHVLEKLKANGVRVVVCRGSVTEYLPELKGVRPRGWRRGTWDSVPGLHRPDAKEVVIATRGHEAEGGAHIPMTGDGHGSQNLVLHETAHALDMNCGAKQSAGSEFAAARDRDRGTLPDYELQPGEAGEEETYAESAARYYSCDQSDEEAHPNLHSYWESDPLKPSL
jgi:uncharacterized Zn-binding protein involved in type VI secretion